MPEGETERTRKLLEAKGVVPGTVKVVQGGVIKVIEPPVKKVPKNPIVFTSSAPASAPAPASPRKQAVKVASAQNKGKAALHGPKAHTVHIAVKNGNNNNNNNTKSSNNNNNNGGNNKNRANKNKKMGGGGNDRRGSTDSVFGRLK